MKSKIWFFMFWALMTFTVLNKFYTPKISGELDRRNKIIFIQPEHLVIYKGDVFKARIQVGYFEPIINEIQELSVNGRRVITDENGIGYFEETATTTGLKRVTVNLGKFQTGITGKSFNPSSDIEYVVHDQKYKPNKPK